MKDANAKFDAMKAETKTLGVKLRDVCFAHFGQSGPDPSSTLTMDQGQIACAALINQAAACSKAMDMPPDLLIMFMLSAVSRVYDGQLQVLDTKPADSPYSGGNIGFMNKNDGTIH